MIHKNCCRAIVFGLFMLILVPFSIFPQTSERGTKESPVEIRNEPRHHLKLENEYVRVWDALIPAGGATLWHIHSNDNVVLTLGDAHVRIETVGAAPVENQAKFGDVAFRKAPYVHRTMSIGTTDFHNIAIEILASPHRSTNADQTSVQTAPKPVIDNERVRVYKISLAPGESTGMRSHSASCLDVALTAGEVETLNSGESTPKRNFVREGALSWRQTVVTRSIKNVGTSRFEAVEIELK